MKKPLKYIIVFFVLIIGLLITLFSQCNRPKAVTAISENNKAIISNHKRVVDEAPVVIKDTAPKFKPAPEIEAYTEQQNSRKTKADTIKASKKIQ